MGVCPPPEMTTSPGPARFPPPNDGVACTRCEARYSQRLGAEVAHIKDFEMDEALRTLDAASKMYQEGSKEEATIQLAAISLLYVRRIRKLEDFLKYYQEFFDPSFKVKVSHTFETQKDADAWLSSGKATDGELVSIAGQASNHPFLIH